MLFGAILFVIAFGQASAKVSFSDNAYKDIVVYIHPDVPENEKLLDNIKSSFTAASSLLYSATRKRFYFGEVTILIPKTWKSKLSYDDAGQESKDNMDVLIEKKGSTEVANTPYTLQTKGCGKMGENIHLTDAFMVDDSEAEKYGPRGKVLVHEWSHYRFGLYDEYPLFKNPKFYPSNDGYIEATRCPLAIKGETYNIETGDKSCNIVDGLPEKACRFKPKSTDMKAFGSLMYKQNLEQITEFCTDDATEKTIHNGDAPNNQNNQCSGKSAWEVIREHEDYKNSETTTIDDTTPIFRLVRKKSPPKIVLVLDISGSMNEENKLNRLRQGCYSFLRFVVSGCSEVGIVLFNETAITTREMTRVTEYSREDLVNDLPKKAGGQTSIGAGLLKALDMLGRESQGSHLIVVSDGEETVEPYIHDVTQKIINSKVTVHAVAITRKAEIRLDELSTRTKGRKYLFAPDNAKSFFAAFREIGESAEDSCNKEKTNTVADQTVPYGKYIEAKRDFILDASLGRDLLIIFEFKNNDVEIEVTSPGGESYDKQSAEFWCQSEYMACQFQLSKAKSGLWTIEFTTRDSRKKTISFTVESKAADPSSKAVNAETLWNNDGPQAINKDTRDPQKVYTKVQQGSFPVLNASVRVNISRPNAAAHSILLRDNGAGADSFADDGIYAANFIAFSEAGRYSAQAYVEGSDSTTINENAVIGIGEITGDGKTDTPMKATGRFKRSAIGQSFQVVSYEPGPGGKNFPPDRIKDMIVTEYDTETFTVTLEWTAVGEQADVGRASEYELRYGLNGTDVRKDFLDMSLVTKEMIINDADLMNPQPADAREVFQISLTSEQDYYSFGVVAIDKKMRNSRSEVSNIAAVSFVIRVPPTNNVVPPKKPVVYIIIGCATAVFVALVIAGVVGFIKCRPAMQIEPIEPAFDLTYEAEISPTPKPSPPPPRLPPPQPRPHRGVRVMV